MSAIRQKPRPIRIGAIKYFTEHGTDVILCVFRDGRKPPKITNELLKKLGVLEPNLDDGESAEWHGPYLMKELPTWFKEKKR